MGRLARCASHRRASRASHTVERELRLLMDVLVETVGPMRQEVREVWFHACEHYGRVGGAWTRRRGGRGRNPIPPRTAHRQLAPIFAGLRPRQAMAIILHLNRTLDKGIAVAVVGYTDALVATLFSQNGVPAPTPISITTTSNGSWS